MLGGIGKLSKQIRINPVPDVAQCQNAFSLIMLPTNGSLRANYEDTQWCCPYWTWFSVLMFFGLVTLISQWLSHFTLSPHTTHHCREHPS